MSKLAKNKTTKSKKAAKRRRSLIFKSIILLIMTAILIVGIVFLVKELSRDYIDNPNNQGNNVTATPTGDPSGENEEDKAKAEKERVMAEADRLAMSYDYDGAIALIQSIEGEEPDAQLYAKIQKYEEEKAKLVPVNIDEVTHIFYHSLIVDPELGFKGNDSIAAGFKQWMTTVDEFNKITQTMYDNGYILVSIRDLVVETTDDNGNVHFVKNENLLLPAGKKAYVLSLDDLSYYHSYDNRGKCFP